MSEPSWDDLECHPSSYPGGKPQKETYPADEARLVAQELVARLKPACEKIEVAGSLRRRKVRVADIEIVFIPLMTGGITITDLFEEPIAVNQAELCINEMLADGVIEQRINSIGRPTWGVKNKLARHRASCIPVDFFTATPENFYNYLVCRTGPSDSNIAICQRAIAKGWKWNPYGNGFSRQGDIHACPSEREVFEFVGLEYKEPWNR